MPTPVPDDVGSIAAEAAVDGAAEGRRIVCGVAIAAGACLAVGFYGLWLGVARRTMLHETAAGSSAAASIGAAVAALLWAVPTTCRAIALALDWIRTPSPSARRIATVAIFLASAGAFYGLAVAQSRPLVPLWHDSNMHLVQAQLLSRGLLWAPPHPLADAMETFFVFVKPVYAAIHFPGTSLLYVPMMWLGVSVAAHASLIAGAIVALCYRLIAEMVDGVCAALAVAALLGLVQLRLVSVMLLSHPAVVVPALLAAWAYLRWRRPADRGGDLRWAAAIGGLLAFAAITRPVEAIAYAVPIAVAMALDLRRAGWRRWLSTLAVAVAAGAPWVSLVLIFNAHVTGHASRPPYEQYNYEFHPGLAYGSTGTDANAAIATNLPQKRDFYRTFVAPALASAARDGPMEALVNERLPNLLATLTPTPFAVAFLVPGLLAMRERRRWVIAAPAAIYLLLCLPYPMFLQHYAVQVIPAGVIVMVSGVHAIGRAFAGVGRRSPEVLAATTLLALCLAGIPVVDPKIRDTPVGLAGATLYAATRLPAEVRQPAITLWRYRDWSQPYDPKQDNPHDEPVYTTDTLWPEDSPIARFHDLGPASNRKIYQFFADRGQGGRTVYVIDRRSGQLSMLGTAAELLAAAESSGDPAPPR